MKKAALLLLALPFLLAATLRWDPVTTDITGAPDPISQYRVFSRKALTTDTFILVGTATGTTFVLPTPAARQEYVVTAIDLSGNESDQSVAVTAKPEKPTNPAVER